MSADNAAIAMRRRFTEQFYRRNRAGLLAAVLACFMGAALNLVISWLMQQIIDACSDVPTALPLIKQVWVFFALVAGFILTAAVDYSSRPRFICRAMRQYKEYAYSEVMKKSIHSFNAENTSTYISAFSNDSTSIENNYIANVFSLIEQLVLCVGALALMLYYSPLLTLIAVGLSVMPIIVSMLIGNRLAVQEKAVSDRNESFLGTLKDMLTGFSVIKSFKAELEALKLFDNRNADAEDAKCKRRKTELLIQTVALVSSLIAQFGVFLVGAYLAVNGRGVTAGVVIVFVQLMNFVLQPIRDVPQILANRKAACALIDKLAGAITANVRREGKTVDNVLDEAIDIRSLSFAYEGGDEVLKDVSMRFKAGGSYAIVGGSGSGKSTLLNLLIGSREDYAGEILYDGDELRQISSESLYDLVTIVQQNVFVFNSSIRDNITMFRDFNQSALDRAISMSGLDGLIKERGADYMCGENGSGLSGGERQRLSIARCLLRGAPVMIVDEATASLDASTAFAVTSSILDIDGLTRIVVTHRLENALMRRYDGIFVMRNGRVEESGTFDELMERKGYFYSLYTVSQ